MQIYKFTLCFNALKCDNSPLPPYIYPIVIPKINPKIYLLRVPSI